MYEEDLSLEEIRNAKNRKELIKAIAHKKQSHYTVYKIGDLLKPQEIGEIIDLVELNLKSAQTKEPK